MIGSQQDVEFQRELENKVWLGQNNRRRRKTALRGDLEAAWLAENDRPLNQSPVENADAVKPLSDANGADRIDKVSAPVDAIPTGSPDSGIQSAVGESGSELPALGRHMLVGLRLVDTDIINTRYGRHRITKYGHTFRDDQGRQYRWYGTNPRPVNLRGYRYPGRYPVLRGVPLTFAANIREIWPDGTVSLSRPYVRLDRQPEATQRIYAREFEIPLDELGLIEQ